MRCGLYAVQPAGYLRGVRVDGRTAVRRRLPAGGVLAAHKGADQTFIDEMIEITKDVWNEPEFNEWIASILLNRFEVYGDEAEAFINEACEKSINAYKYLSGQS